jgi:hypothetical protein
MMKFNWRSMAITLSLGSVGLLAACSGNMDDLDSAGDDADEQYVADENGVVLGTTWEALSYPYCMSPFSDPDGDGWGWEYNRSCVVYRAPGTGGTSGTAGRGGSGGTGGSAGTAGRGGSSAGGTSTGGTSTGGSTSATCPNQEGTASTMAAIAVSAAMELKRWQPTKDFAIGRVSNLEALVLTSTGKARCSDGVCANTQALLDFQKPEASGKVKFPGNVSLDSTALRSRLVAKFRDQVGCEMQPSNGGTTNCPVEEHTLTFQRSEKGGCDTNYFFVAKKTDGTALKYPAQLKNKLLWTDRVNPYIGFQSVGEVVSIDPTYGLNEAGSTSTGACSGACVKISMSDQAGACCSCNGATRKFAKSPWSGRTFLCQ